jgi:hypothetical protein
MAEDRKPEEDSQKEQSVHKDKGLDILGGITNIDDLGNGH